MPCCSDLADITFCTQVETVNYTFRKIASFDKELNKDRKKHYFIMRTQISKFAEELYLY